jgi:tetratricopeptide (TPR) repeat protein
MLSPKRKIAFFLVPYLLVLVVLVLIEVGLRIFDNSLAPSLYSDVKADGIEWYQINRGYLRKYFPSDVAMLPELKPGLMRKQKAPGAVRIFCLGESSMFGTPYQMSATMPAIVRKQLRHLFPDREFEVINLGASAINSNVLLDLSRQIVDLHPDAILLYAGHNEFYGPDGVGASFLERWWPGLTQVKYRLRELRLVLAGQKLLRALLPPRPAVTGRNMMREVSQGAYVALGSADAERVFQNFRSNLTDIASIFKKQGIPIIVSDVTSNLTFPPFAAGDSTATEELRETFSSAGPEATYTRAEQLRQQDSTNAMANFCLGMWHLERGRTGVARRYLILARDNDLLKFRAPSATNEIIRRTCTEIGLPMISADSALASAAPDGIPGRQYFWEHLHLTARSYALIASRFVDELLALHMLSAGPPGPLESRKLPFQPDSLDICWLDQAYADLSMKTLTSRWPFRSYPVEPVVMQSADAVLQSIATAVYTQRMPWDEGCYKSAEHLRQVHDYQSAVTSYKAMIDDYPFDFSRHYLLGNVLKEMGKTMEAVEEYATSIALNSAYPYARLELGLLQINQGKFDQAITQLSTALDLAEKQHSPPATAGMIYYGLSAARANKGQYPDAIRLVDQALRILPSYEPALRLRSQLQRYQ